MQVFETPGAVALRVELPAGSLRIATWAEPRVEVEVEHARGDEGSRLAAEETRVEATERGGRHVISVRAPKREGRFGLSWGRGPELEVVIRAPEGADVELETHGADLEGRGPLGEVTVRSASGDVEVLDTQSLSFTTASGDLSAGAVGGPLVAKSASGDVDVRAVGGPSTVNTVSGDVRLGETGEGATVSTVSGDVELALVEGGVRITAVSGDAEVAVRPGLSLWIDAQSVSGSITSELDVGDAPSEGDGYVELRVRTVSGDVRLTKARATSSSPA